MDTISKHLSYREATYSNTAKKKGISNIPSSCQLHNMEVLSKLVFEPIRIHFSVPIHVSSMFRSKELNEAIGGAKNSQHLADKGAAMDIDADKYGNVTNKEIFMYIKDNLMFDQLIWEFGNEEEPAWIHVSYSAGDNRGEVLVAYKDSFNKTKYKVYGETS